MIFIYSYLTGLVVSLIVFSVIETFNENIFHAFSVNKVMIYSVFWPMVWTILFVSMITDIIINWKNS